MELPRHYAKTMKLPRGGGAAGHVLIATDSFPQTSLMSRMAHKSPKPACRAFTLIDLLAILALGVFLVLVAVPALAHSQRASDTAICANNLRQLMQAWQMYSDDNAGTLMANPPVGTSGYLGWVKGVLDFNANTPDNFNAAYLTNSANAAMGQYVHSASLFRCPADHTFLLRSSVPTYRVRSYSMNSYLGPAASGYSAGYQIMVNQNQISQPERTFALLEEHPGSINDGSLIVDVASTGSATVLVDVPAAFHAGAATIAFADGHTELWQWTDARTMPPIGGVSVGNIACPNNADVTRLQKVTTYHP